MEIKTQDVWIDTGVTNPEPIFIGGVQIHTTLEKHTGIIVLTKEQYDKNIEAAILLGQSQNGLNIQDINSKMIVLTKEEFEKAIGDTFEAGACFATSKMIEGAAVFPDKTEYIINLFETTEK